MIQVILQSTSYVTEHKFYYRIQKVMLHYTSYITELKSEYKLYYRRQVMLHNTSYITKSEFYYINTITSNYINLDTNIETGVKSSFELIYNHVIYIYTEQGVNMHRVFLCSRRRAPKVQVIYCSVNCPLYKILI